VPICAGGNTTLSASGGNTYVWAPSNSLSNANISNPVATPGTTTTYIVTVTNSNNCSATDNVVVTVNPLPIVSAGPPKSICIGGNATLEGSGGTTYLWAPASSLSSTSISTPTASPTITTTYTLTVTNANGCTGTSSTVLTVNNLPNVSAGSNATICTGQNTTLNGSGGVTYTWAPAGSLSSSTIAQPVATPTVTTTYAATITDANGCSGTSNVVVTVNPLPPANAGTDQIICLNQSANLTAHGGVQYQWSTNVFTQSINVSPQTSTVYSVTVTDANGCSATDGVSVTVNPLPPTNAGADVSICIGNSTVLGASGGISYVWSPSGSLSNSQVNNPTASPTATTTYTVTATDQNGCSASDNMVVTVNVLPTASAGANTSICLGHSTTLNATGGVSYQWSPGLGLNNPNIPSPIANPTTTTTYTVSITDNNSCSATSSMVLTVHALPIANAGVDAAICLNQSTTLNAGGGVSYLWSPALNLSQANIFNPVASPLNTTTYTVTVTDGNGCSATDNMVLTVQSLPPADAGASASICYGTSTLLNATGGVSYNWSPSGTLSQGNIQSPIASPTVSTTYVVTVTDANGCSETDAVTVHILSLPPANAGANTAICEGANATLTASGGISYVWSTGSNTQSVTVSPPVTTTYVVTVTDGNNCSETDDVVVVVNYPPPASAGSDISICLGDAGALNASGGVSYSWSPPQGLSNAGVSNPLASPSVQSTYTVTVTDAQGCSATDAVVVFIFPAPIIFISADKYNGCEPLLVQFADSSQHIQSWQWDFGDPSSGAMNQSNQQHPMHLFSDAGTYTVTITVTSADGCVKSESYNNMITVYPNPIASFTHAPPFGSIEFPFISFIDQSINANKWFWHFGDAASISNTSVLQHPTHKFSAEGNYLVVLSVQSVHGCVDSTSGLIRILPDFSIYIPNAFTPNGDGINEGFKAYATNVSEFTMYIFNRWGELLFETDNIHIPWDGRSFKTDEPMMQDVYVYKIIVKDLFGKTHQYIGRVTLLLSR